MKSNDLSLAHLVAERAISPLQSVSRSLRTAGGCCSCARSCHIIERRTNDRAAA